ncbi:MAG: type VI secretion system tip protein TssI/VgrG [Polyangiaceae bacterium]
MGKGDITIQLDSEDFPTANVQIARLTGRERLSELFSFELDIVCHEPDELNIDMLAGSSADLVFVHDATGDELRRIHAVVHEVEDAIEPEAGTRGFRLWLGPRTTRLTLVETQEVYLDMSVPEIVCEKLRRAGFVPQDIELRLSGTYPKRELVVQYKESDLTFISRLMEHLGITFSFEHSGGRDILILSDTNTALPALDSVPFRGRGDPRDVFDLRARKRLSPKRYDIQDYNYRTPQIANLTGGVTAPFGYGGNVVEYGSHVKTPDDAEALARVRAEERWCADDYLMGKSDLATFSAGRRVVIEGHPQLGDVPVVLVEVEHHASQSIGMHGAAKGGEGGYHNTFRAVLVDRTFRPPRVTPRPRILGVVSGLVVGPTGELTGDIAKIDDHGRYTIRILFDTVMSEAEQKASHPIRMAQPHAGPGYGMHFPLKPGIEVLLIFIDGDPDRPIIIASVPNHITPSPVTSANASMHRIRTASGILIELDDANA